MSDPEYSEHFVFYYTSTKTIRIVSNPLQLTILRHLAKSVHSLTELVSMTCHPKTTVKSSIDHLEKCGLITGMRDKDDRRRILYHLSGIPVMKDTSGKTNLLDSTGKIMKNMIENGEGFFEDYLTVLFTMAEKHRVDLSGCLLKLGIDCGLYLYEKYGVLDVERIIGSFLKYDERLKMEIDYSDGLKLTIWSEVTDIDLLKLLTYPMFGILVSIIPQVTRINYSMDFTETYFPEKNMVVLSSECYKGRFFEPGRDWLSWNHDEKPQTYEGYAIYLTGDRTYLLTNRTMCSIMDCLQNGPRSVMELSDELGLKVVNLYPVLNKLTNIGMVVKTKTEGQGQTYSSLSQRALSVENICGIPEGGYDLFGEYDYRRKEDHTFIALRYLNILFGQLGVYIGDLNERIHHEILDNLFDLYPSMDRKTYLDIMCVMTHPSDRFSVLSYEEPAMRLEIGSDSALVNSDLDYKIKDLKAVIEMGLEKVEGRPVPIRFETVFH